LESGHTTPLQEGGARVGDDQQLADKNRSMAAIERDALRPLLAERAHCGVATERPQSPVLPRLKNSR
jgi:hypothetical protein